MAKIKLNLYSAAGRHHLSTVKQTTLHENLDIYLMPCPFNGFEEERMEEWIQRRGMAWLRSPASISVTQLTQISGFASPPKLPPEARLLVASDVQRKPNRVSRPVCRPVGQLN